MANKVFSAQTGVTPVNPVTTADNGLTGDNEGNIALGGNLTGNTDVVPNGHNLTIGPLTVTDSDVQSSAVPASPDDLLRLTDLTTALLDVVLNLGGSPSIEQGLFSAIPIFGNVGALYYATDQGTFYRDNGTAWVDLNVLHSTGFPAQVLDTVLTMGATGGVGLGAININNTLAGAAGHPGIEITSNNVALLINSGRSDVADRWIFRDRVEVTGSGSSVLFQDPSISIFSWKMLSVAGSSDVDLRFIFNGVATTYLQFSSTNNGDILDGAGRAFLKQGSSGIITVVASNKVTGSGTSGNLITYAVPGSSDATYRINFYYLVRTGTGTIGITITYTNEASGTSTITTSAIAAGASDANPIVINCKSVTNIVIDSVITGTAIGDFYTYVEFLG